MFNDVEFYLRGSGWDDRDVCANGFACGEGAAEDVPALRAVGQLYERRRKDPGRAHGSGSNLLTFCYATERGEHCRNHSKLSPIDLAHGGNHNLVD